VKYLTIGSLVAVLTCASAAAQPGTMHEEALAKAAADLGYAYSYLGPQDAVELSRPGVTILVRPGERLFDVNDRTEAMDGPAPRFSHADLYVSDVFVARLKSIADRYPIQSNPDHAMVVTPSNPSDSAPMTGTGTIDALSVSQKPGTWLLNVAGKAPANLPVLITLTATLASELPDTVLSRTEVTPNPDGRFTAAVSVAPGYLRGAYITVVASSVPGVVAASKRVVMKAPNQDLSVPSEEVQKSIR
jgi:hypothetical protein